MGMDFYVEVKSKKGDEPSELLYAGNSLFDGHCPVAKKVGTESGKEIFQHYIVSDFYKYVKPFRHYSGAKALSVLDKVKDCINPNLYDEIVYALKVRGSYFWCWW